MWYCVITTKINNVCQIVRLSEIQSCGRRFRTDCMFDRAAGALQLQIAVMVRQAIHIQLLVNRAADGLRL